MQPYRDFARIHGVIEAGKDLCSHRVTAVTDQHRVNQSLALSATSSLSLNSPRDGDPSSRVLSLSPALFAAHGDPCRDCVCQGPRVTAQEGCCGSLSFPQQSLGAGALRGLRLLGGDVAATRPLLSGKSSGSPQTLSPGQRLAVLPA